MNIVGLYIGGVTPLGSGEYRLNDCYIQSNWQELRINDGVTDSNGNTFIVTNFQTYPGLGQENMWIEVLWPDWPTTDIAPVDDVLAGDYESTVGSLVSSGYTPEISYLCRIIQSTTTSPAYHYQIIISDIRYSEPGAGLGAVGDYVLDSGGRVYEITEWNGSAAPITVKDIKELPIIASSQPVVGEYAYIYRPTESAEVMTQGILHDLSTDALDGAVNYNNTMVWKKRGVFMDKDSLELENVTKITIGEGLGMSESGGGWLGGNSVELSASLDGGFTGGQRITYTATAGQSVFPIEYTIGFVDVWMNGFKLVDGQDFTAITGTSITLTDPATNGDIVDLISYDTFSISNHYTKNESDTNYVGTIGDTIIDGELTAHAFNLTSSREHKENIQMCMDDAIQLINRIEIVEYNYKTDDLHQKRVGFIAEETPELFSGWNQVHFDVGNTVGVLIKAVQELNDRLERLEGDDE